MPEDLVIIGCEPKEISMVKMGLTEEVSSTIPNIMRLILEETAVSARYNTLI